MIIGTMLVRYTDEKLTNVEDAVAVPFLKYYLEIYQKR